MGKFKNLLLGGLLIVFTFVFHSFCSQAADKPICQIEEKTWKSITISVTFQSDSEYNRVSLSSPYDSSENSTSDIMYLKGTYTYTFDNLKNPGALYFITIYYGDNEFRIIDIRTFGIPSGKHVRIDLDFEKYLKDNISYNRFIRWLDHLDAAYESYYNLVGAKPNNGAVINIVSSSENYGHMWVYGNTSTIYWNQKYIATDLKQIDKEDDWHFGTLHEMGHLFDLDDRWNFDSEFFANFKMAYVFYELDGNFRVKLRNKILTKYSEIIDYYYSESDVSYTKSIGADPMVYTADGLTYMFLNVLKEFGWTCIKSTFTYYNEAGESGSRPPIQSFLSVTNYFLPKTNPITAAFSKYYGDGYEFVIKYLNSRTILSTSSNIIVD